MTQKKREATEKRIGDIGEKIAELTKEGEALRQALDDDDKERLVGAVKRNRLSVDDAIALISKPKTAEAERGNIKKEEKEHEKPEKHENPEKKDS